MKKALILLVLFLGVPLMAQEQSTITVKNSDVSGDVVVVNAMSSPAVQGKPTMELHCNKGASSCKTVTAGTYLMVRLPKNWGMYDCANVDLYPASADPASSQKIGEYCLTEK
jgi:hypothetical protein